MKSYLKSITVHIVVLLALLMMWRYTPDTHAEQMQSVIVVDFREASALAKQVTNQPKRKITQGKKSDTQKTKSKVTPKPNQPDDNAPLPKVSQKPRESVRTSPTQEKAAIVAKQKEIEAEQKRLREEADKKAKAEALKKEQEEAERKRQQAEQQKKKTFFKSMFNKSKKENDAQAASGSSSQSSDSSQGHGKKAKNIDGAIGGREVMYIPTILDHTQKQGRVVVKICVNKKGRVISANYSQVGSTTSDAELIKLAQEGAMKYKFSSSAKERECGRILIDFLLRA